MENENGKESVVYVGPKNSVEERKKKNGQQELMARTIHIEKLSTGLMEKRNKESRFSGGKIISKGMKLSLNTPLKLNGKTQQES